MYYVYLHNNKLNNKKYIGITKQEPMQRWGNNGKNYHSSPHFYSAIKNMDGTILTILFYMII